MPERMIGSASTEYVFSASSTTSGRVWRPTVRSGLGRGVGDIIREDYGARYRLVEDKNGTVLQDEDDEGIFYDEKCRQRFKVP